ncbi:MAG: DUF3142 domain-containing protein [bacterium]
MRAANWRGMIAVLLLTAGLGLGYWNSQPAPACRDWQPEVYIWQRAWTPEVREAMVTAAPSVGAFAVQLAEIDGSTEPPGVRGAAIDWALLASLQHPVTLTIRLASDGPDLTVANPQVALIQQRFADGVEDATAAGVTIASIQLDYDCPTEQLTAYTEVLASLKRKNNPLPLTITALPAWLDSPGMEALAHAVDGYALQVHSLQRPDPDSSAITVCDPRLARRWIDQAARLGRPFTVVLPAYGYAVGHDAAGRVTGLLAEQAFEGWPAGTVTVDEVTPDPSAMAALVRELRDDPPQSFQGCVWFRLPVSNDRRGWRWCTLAKVMAGTAPSPRFEVALTHAPEGAIDCTLRNVGDADGIFTGAVAITSSAATEDDYPWHDALNRGAMLVSAANWVEWRPGNPEGLRLRPGDECALGWVRWEHPGEVRAHVVAPPE